MKKLLAGGLAALLSIGAVTCAAAADGEARFDFEKDDAGFAPIYADYPNSEGVKEFYEFRHEYAEVPIDGAGNGIFISGNNHSDDLFMGYVKTQEGFVPARTYHFSVSFKLATDVEGGLVGVGGAPGEGVTVKCGVTPTEPATTLVSNGYFDYYRLNIDAGRQSNGGADMVVVGDMAKTENNLPGKYEFKEFRAEFDVAAGARGEVYLIIGTDSGFEATTSYYLDDVTVAWEEAAEQPFVTRAQAAQMLFNTADRPGADPASCPFGDVAADNPNAEAITWAHESGYLYGYEDKLFRPENCMTVEQAMVMIYRFFGSPAADRSVLSGYEDGEQVSSWAKDAVAWTIANEVFRPDRAISPQPPRKIRRMRCRAEKSRSIFAAARGALQAPAFRNAEHFSSGFLLPRLEQYKRGGNSL